ncbi:MAG: methionyl-tRNA formyltransferase, partial [Flavobacteriaceae bacterium]|nr:methionyl-tRNA formyltransferase [Flavobacteriaceae bacterium]
MVDNLEYNSDRPHLIIPEYGRHIQKMIEHTVAIEDREERNKSAKG